MKEVLVLLAIIAVAAAAGGFEKGLRVKFDMGTDPSAGETYFYDIPTSVADARSLGWRLSRRPSAGRHLPQLVMLCPTDKVLCALYDDTEYIAGLQVAVSKLDFTENVYDKIKQGFTSWNTDVGGVCKKFWTLQQYFVSEEFLQISKEERLASRNSSELLQAGAIWLVGTDKKLTRVPIKEDEILEEGVFTEQACIAWMGQHYYYNMSSTTECTADQMFPWFPMTMNGDLIATGFLTFGTLAMQDGERDWFERPTQAVVEAIVPYGPQCMYDQAGDPGALTMHIYYIDQPWTITC